VKDAPPPVLVSEPTADQIERFRKLSVEQRFHWLVDTLALCFELATPQARAQWRKQGVLRRSGTMSPRAGRRVYTGYPLLIRLRLTVPRVVIALA
jgi:hypothetical protein